MSLTTPSLLIILIKYYFLFSLQSKKYRNLSGRITDEQNQEEEDR